jgi:hypothetical protein
MHRPHHQFTGLAILAVLATIVVGACGGGTASVAPAASVVAPAPSASAAVRAPIAAAPVVLTLCPTRTLPWDGKRPLDLTGVWSVDGHGMYYITQVENAVWWIGLSGLGDPVIDAGQEWANAFEGTATGTTVSGTYVDVPKGGSNLNGPVKLEIRRTAEGNATLVRTNPDSETQFGGMVFTPCTAGRS